MDRNARLGLSQHNLKRLSLRLAQAAWLGAAGLAIGLSFAGLPARLRELAFDNLPDAISYSVLALELFLVLAEKTVRNHISNIFNNLQVATRSDAILAARAAGLGGRQADQTD